MIRRIGYLLMFGVVRIVATVPVLLVTTSVVRIAPCLSAWDSTTNEGTRRTRTGRTMDEGIRNPESREH